MSHLHEQQVAAPEQQPRLTNLTRPRFWKDISFKLSSLLVLTETASSPCFNLT